MRSFMVLEEEADFNAWLATQPTFADTQAVQVAASNLTPVEQGQQIAQSQGCIGCHSVDGSPGVGPTWKDLFGKTENLADGSTTVVDDEYLIESIVAPNASMVAGYPPIMPPYELDEADLSALIAYIKAL
jgi:cytochrome c oxidase subunit 2